MSYSMRIRAKESPTVAEVLKVVATPELRCTALPDGFPTDLWPKGVGHYYRAGFSSRGVELTIESGIVQVRMVSMANLEDWELGFRLLQALAADPTEEVDGEDGTVSTLSDTRARFQEVLLREMAVGFLSIQKQLDEYPDMMVVMRGPVREVFIGRRCLEELSTGTTDEVVALMERIRRVQYIESEGFQVRQPIELMAAAGIRASLWAPEKAQAFELTDYLGLSAPMESLYVTVASLPKLVGSRFQWIDEKQFAIQAIPESELAALYAQAATMSVNPFAKLKKWWQFWK